MRSLHVFVLLAQIIWMLPPSDCYRADTCQKKRDCHRHSECHMEMHEAAVASNAEECADIGMEILRKKGSAVDAAIATLICEGASIPQSVGIGGGFVATIYDAEEEIAETLDAREVAPQDCVSRNHEHEEGSYVAVPGEIAGYWEMHQKYGRLPWDELFAPTIKLCRHGVLMSKYLRKVLIPLKNAISKESSLAEIFIDPVTKDLWQEGQRFTLIALAKTLETIAMEGADALYCSDGSLLEKLLKDLHHLGSSISEDDFVNYRPIWRKPAQTQIRGCMTVYTAPTPASGHILNYILEILDGYKHLTESESLTWHRIIESFKHGYGMRTRLGDPDFVDHLEDEIEKLTNKHYVEYIRDIISCNVTYTERDHYGAVTGCKESHGTAHVSVLAPNGDAVSVTSTIGSTLGARIRSKSTGIIFNDQIREFSQRDEGQMHNLLASPANSLEPGKRPMSSMTPTIIVDCDGHVRLVVGAGGGSKITSSTALFILRTLFFKEDLCYSVNVPRLHHQLGPHVVEYENGFDQSVLRDLESMGHDTQSTNQPLGIAAVTAIMRDSENEITAVFDHRRTGSVSMYGAEHGGYSSCMECH